MFLLFFKKGKEVVQLSGFSSGQCCHGHDNINGVRQGGSTASSRHSPYRWRVRRDVLIAQGWRHLGSKCVLCRVEPDAVLIKNIIKMSSGFSSDSIILLAFKCPNWNFPQPTSASLSN